MHSRPTCMRLPWQLLRSRDFSRGASTARFSRIKRNFFDDATVDKTRKQIYEELAGLVAGQADASAQAEKKEAILQKLAIAAGSGNSGHSMQQTLKFYVKYHRARSIHVTPTVLVNGLEAGEISSSFTEEQWMEWLMTRL
mmetsp:Transcript_9619/g.24598  ORF Transcript_9619/g.24598 Transcript_9619/m.24598 type:complete len:140 (+) Transcript_9619:233-652(+)